MTRYLYCIACVALMWLAGCAQPETEGTEMQDMSPKKKLEAVLDTLLKNDQGNRMKVEETQRKYGNDSKEMEALWQTINYNDSLDMVKVAGILDKYGWPDEDVAGSEAVFLVIQHADLDMQQKYLPVVRAAVKEHKVGTGDLAMLEDRIALREGHKQIYGTQIGMGADGSAWVSPLDDPDNVDKRRKEAGLGTMAENLDHWNMKWDVTEYKKHLPEIEKKEKRQ
jgi:hypothetical protein